MGHEKFPAIDLGAVAHALKLSLAQVSVVAHLLDDGNTVPFITRYRKDQTGGLDEEQIRHIEVRLGKLRMLAERRQTILRSIESQGKLTPELAAEIAAAEGPKQLEDLYLPFKPKKQTLATAARERGLEPLAEEILAAAPACENLDARAADFINADRGVPTAADALLGVGHILAERFSERADLRRRLRKIVNHSGRLVSAKTDIDEKQAQGFRDFFTYSEQLERVPPHRVLAINRGEKAKMLRVKVEADQEAMQQTTDELLMPADHPHGDFLRGCGRDALARLVFPSLEREVRRELTDWAEAHAVHVFARNLRNLLLQPPVRGRRVLAVDPGFKSGCKLAALDEFGALLDKAVIHLVGKPERREQGKQRLVEMVKQHELNLIAIGNGTACREAEALVSELLSGESPSAEHPTAERPAVQEPNVEPPTVEPPTVEPPTVEPPNAELSEAEPPTREQPADPQPTAEAADVEPPADEPPVAAVPVEKTSRRFAGALAESGIAYVIVNEAGASVYSTSPLGREEFPEYDATLRSAISIGRRVQDPLSELVKIDPANLGVGLYQHDVKAKHLRTSLDAVVESCVNFVGVDLNTASPSLLRYVSGLNQLTARRLFDYRTQQGPFRNREQLKEVPGFGEATFVQAAGFLKISGDNPLDATWIHPESYPLAERVLSKLESTATDLADKEAVARLNERTAAVNVAALAPELGAGDLLLKDILAQLTRPGRDPREDLPPPMFKKGVLKLEDLTPGMELVGAVLNVVDFGAFVDIGLHDTGLIHISQLANRYVRDPHEIVSVGDIVKVWVHEIDKTRRRVSLTMLAPGTERSSPPQRGQRATHAPQTVGAPAGGDGQHGGGPPRTDRPRRGSRPKPDRRGAQPAGAGAGGGGGSPGGGAGGGGQTSAPPSGGPSQHGKAKFRAHAPAKPPRPPKPLKPLTTEMKAGKAPLRTFGDLKQFLDLKKAEPPASEAGEGS